MALFFSAQNWQTRTRRNPPRPRSSPSSSPPSSSRPRGRRSCSIGRSISVFAYRLEGELVLFQRGLVAGRRALTAVTGRPLAQHDHLVGDVIGGAVFLAYFIFK